MKSMSVKLCDGQQHIFKEIVKISERRLPLFLVGAFHYAKTIS
jgi:hypothetical protein